MISASTASHQFENEYFIQRAVGQRAAFAIDLDMDIHALHPKINARSHARIAILHSPIWIASDITSLSSYQANNASSKAFVNSDTTANFAGKLYLHGIQAQDVINVANQCLMMRFVRDAGVFTDGTCPALSNRVASIDLTQC